jgi:hypothetical protein
MFSLNELNSFGQEMERRLLLRTSPIAIMLLENEKDMPKKELLGPKGILVSIWHFAKPLQCRAERKRRWGC